MGDRDTRSGRDTRLLALVIVISLAVLFVLARVRFPDADQRTAPVTTSPLERLAVRASFDDLAAAVMSVLSRAAASVVVLDVAMPEVGPMPEAGGAPGTTAPIAPNATPRRIRVMGVRLTDGTVAAHVPAGLRVILPDGTFADAKADVARGITVLSLPATPDDPFVAPSPVAGVAGFTYVAAIEAAIGGPSAAPVFIGRLDPVEDQTWGGTLLVPGGTLGVATGALVFTLEGRFVGLVVPRQAGGRAIAPLSALERAAAAGRAPGGGGGP